MRKEVDVRGTGGQGVRQSVSSGVTLKELRLARQQHLQQVLIDNRPRHERAKVYEQLERKPLCQNSIQNTTNTSSTRKGSFGLRSLWGLGLRIFTQAVRADT